MPFKISQCVSYHHPAKDNVVKFYRDVIGLEVVSDDDNMAELKAGLLRLFVDKRDRQQLVLELIVDDLQQVQNHRNWEQASDKTKQILSW